MFRGFDQVTAQPDGWDDESLDKVSGLLHFLNCFLFYFLVCVFLQDFRAVFFTRF